MLVDKCTLLDIGFTTRPLDEGGKHVAYLFFDSKRIDPRAKERKLNLISSKVDKTLGPDSFKWLDSTIKKVADRFFRHSYCPAAADDSESTYLAVWHWEKAETNNQPDDISLVSFTKENWFELAKTTNDYYDFHLQGRRVLDVKF